MRNRAAPPHAPSDSRVAEGLGWAAAALCAVAAPTGLFASGIYRATPFWTEQARRVVA